MKWCDQGHTSCYSSHGPNRCSAMSSKETGIGDLSAFADLDDGPFSEVVKMTFLILTREKVGTEPVIEGLLKPLGATRARQVYAALTSSILEAARADHSAAQYQSSLEDSGLGPDQSKLLVAAYEHKRAKLRDVLGRIGFGALDLVGLDWRLDYHIKSSVTGNDNEPVYYLTVKTVDGDGRPQDIRMACTLEELQDLRAKVKDAAKQAERILAAGQLDS